MYKIQFSGFNLQNSLLYNFNNFTTIQCFFIQIHWYIDSDIDCICIYYIYYCTMVRIFFCELPTNSNCYYTAVLASKIKIRFVIRCLWHKNKNFIPQKFINNRIFK